MNVLSLFDGMACGMLAMQGAGIEVERYVAYEIDKYAVQTSSHNFPMIEHRGDVFGADFTEFADFDFLVGGSPCTYWSVAKTVGRETEASGMGWELFSQYVRALHEAKPKFFVYENNKSMSKAIRASIDEAFGFEAIGINSALVSAQNRQRLYWVGKRNDDGTYSKVNVEQPEDRGILLKHILKNGVAEPVCLRYERSEEAKAVRKSYEAGELKHGFHELHELHPRTDGKTNTLSTVLKDNPILEPVGVGYRNRREEDGKLYRRFETHNEEKSNALTTVRTDSMVAESVLCAIPSCSMVVKEATKKGYTEIEPMDCVDMTQPNSKTRRGRRMKDKSNCCMTSCQYYQCCGVLGYATPCEWDENGNVIKAVSVADGKTYSVYEVEDGHITIKGKQYPIKLVDGSYIIRKLTVKECMRLQTVPEWYKFPVSDSQAYKMLGNGWTVDVITHLLRACR